MKDADAQELQKVVNAIVAGMGRGGLSYISAKLGMSPSAMLKRLKSPQAFDPVSLRCVLLVAELRGGELPALTRKKVGRYVIRTHDTEDGVQPSWSLK